MRHSASVRMNGQMTWYWDGSMTKNIPFIITQNKNHMPIYKVCHAHEPIMGVQIKFKQTRQH